jgi:hypothetical protein
MAGSQRVSWDGIRSRLDTHRIDYETPGQVWTDGLPLGNGDLAALAYAPYWPEWVINKLDVWDYRHPQHPKRRTMNEIRDLLAAGGSIYDLLDEAAPDQNLHPMPKTCGVLRFHCHGDPFFAPPYRITQHLDLATGTLEERLDRHMSHPRLTSFVCAERNVMVLRARDVSAYVSARNTLELMRPPDAVIGEPTPGAAGDTAWLDMCLPDGLRYVLMIRAVPTGRFTYRGYMRRRFRKGFALPRGDVRASVNGHIAGLTVAGDFTAYLTVVTSLEAADPMARARELLAEAAHAGVGRLLGRQRAWWRGFWLRAARFSASEPFIEGYWYASLYAGASTLRRAPAPGLCGLWYGPGWGASQDLPWLGMYTHDYNMQLSAAPWPTLGVPQLSRPYIDTLFNALPAVLDEARRRYGIAGAMYPLGSGPDCRDVSDPLYRHCEHPCGPFWAAVIAGWDAVLGDTRLLRTRFYPVVREIARFFANYMKIDPATGRYRLWPTQPAEYFYLDKANPPATLTLVRRTLAFAVSAARRLRTDAALVRQWQDVLERFPEYPRDRGVWTIAEGIPREHYMWGITSWMLWPAGEIRPDSPRELCATARRTMDYLHPRLSSFSWAQRTGAHQGSFGSATLHALGELRFGNATEAWRIFAEDALRLFPKPNGLIAHNPSLCCSSAVSEGNLRNIPALGLLDGDAVMPLAEPSSGHLGSTTENWRHREFSAPVSEGNAGYLLFISEMLLQSWAGRLEVFAGFRPQAATFAAAFAGLHAEGGFVVSAARRDGTVRFVHIRSRRGGLLRLVNPWPGQTVRWQSSRGNHGAGAGDLLEIPTRRGEEIVFRRAGAAVRVPADGFEPVADSAPGPRALRFSDGAVCWYGKPGERLYFDPGPPGAPTWPVHGPGRRRAPAPG